jgi:hypothetical protein
MNWLLIPSMPPNENSYTSFGSRILLDEKIGVRIRRGLPSPGSKLARRWPKPIRQSGRCICKLDPGKSCFHFFDPSGGGDKFKLPITVVSRAKWEYSQCATLACLDTTMNDGWFGRADTIEHITVIRLGIERVNFRRGAPANEKQRTEKENIRIHDLFARGFHVSDRPEKRIQWQLQRDGQIPC